jgi:hypothetical protein
MKQTYTDQLNRLLKDFATLNNTVELLNNTVKPRKSRVKAEKCSTCGHVLKKHIPYRPQVEITDSTVVVQAYCYVMRCACILTKVFHYLEDGKKEDGAKEEKIVDNSRKILWD